MATTTNARRVSEPATQATVQAASHRTSGSMLRVQLGAALQKQRLRRGLTQSQLAEFAGLSLKYVGEIERGEANTTLDALERLADACEWDPLSSLDVREPVTEGIRLLLIEEVGQMVDRMKTMMRWLHALDPARHPAARLVAGVATMLPEFPPKRVRSRARPHPKRRSM